MSIAFRQSRPDKGEQEEGDYINCPMNPRSMRAFVEALLSGQLPSNSLNPHFFEVVCPSKALAARGRDALAFGPMRPVGLIDPAWAATPCRRSVATGTI